MKKIIFLLILIFLSNNDAFSQAESKQIDIYKKALGFEFSRNGYPKSLTTLKSYMEPHSTEDLLIRKAIGLNVTSSIISGVGGFIIGYQLANLTFRGHGSNQQLKRRSLNRIGIGTAIIAISVPFKIMSDNKALGAVDHYNKKLDTTYQEQQAIHTYVNVSPSGIGITVGF